MKKRKSVKHTHLTTGKKSVAYQTSRIVQQLKQRPTYDTGLSSNTEDVESKSKVTDECRSDVSTNFNASTQTGVPKKDASTSTGNTMRNLVTHTTQTENVDNITQKKLQDWDCFYEKLVEAKQYSKFQKLVTAIGCGNLKCSNLAWKSCLDMGVLSTLKSTTSMRYDKDCCEFFSLFYIMFGGSAVNVLRGTANFGCLVDNETYHGHYDPIKGSFNFAIPSINTLMKISSGYPKQVDVGFVHHSLDLTEELARKGLQFVLGFDGKMVAQGCKDESNGDVNLWGCEKPSISSCIRNLRIKKFCAENIQRPYEQETKEHKQLKYQCLALHISRTLKLLRSRIAHTYRQ
ncbi:MAG: hypothetical protein MJE68_03965 [Proteobacteria bacterium]|nr:hypothetical protein [Pseudomonadota bacterium]